VHKEPHPVDLQAVSFKELTMVGTRVYTRDNYRQALEMITDLPWEEVVSHRVNLDRGAEGFDIMGQAADACKVLIKTD
jgi:threonine dehydrogenase-like Zn-dependent dehydrogenase